MVPISLGDVWVISLSKMNNEHFQFTYQNIINIQTHQSNRKLRYRILIKNE